jgi:hypothetical protein
MSKTPPSAEQSDDQYYLPGVSISASPGPVERFLTRLFRRRGRF